MGTHGPNGHCDSSACNTVSLLSACWEWEVAGPLIGVGAVGTGVTIAAARGAPSPGPNASEESQSGDNRNPVAAHSAGPQSLDHGSGPVTETLPAFATSPTLPPTAAATDARNSHLRHQRETSARDDAHSATARHPDRRAGPVMTVSKSSTAPATLSPSVATTKGPPSARMSHVRVSTSRVLVSSAKPQPLDHRSGSVAAASPDTASPGELPTTTIVH